MLLELSLIPVAITVAVIFFIAKQNKRPKIDLRGKHVVITGGSSGIGRSLAFQVTKEGANVTIIARNKDRLQKIKDELSAVVPDQTQKIHIESLDIAKSFDDTKETFERIESEVGPIDILINNAGIFKCSTFSDLTARDFEQHMNINYMGTVYCTKAVVESMKRRKFGRIAFVSSQAGQIGIYGYTAYSPTKFALRGLAEALQMELSPYNIFCTLSYPPDTDTPGLKEENIGKPSITSQIAGGSGVLDPKDVADQIISSLKAGSFHCSYGVNGFLLTTLNTGASTITNFKDALIEIFALPLCRIIAIVLSFYFDTIAKSGIKKTVQS